MADRVPAAGADLTSRLDDCRQLCGAYSKHGERGRGKSVAVRGRVGRQVSIVVLIRIQTFILSPSGSGFHFRKARAHYPEGHSHSWNRGCSPCCDAEEPQNRYHLDSEDLGKSGPVVVWAEVRHHGRSLFLVPLLVLNSIWVQGFCSPALPMVFPKNGRGQLRSGRHTTEMRQE